MPPISARVLPIAFSVAAALLHPAGARGQFHAAVNGGPSGDGSPAHPWDLQTALSAPPVLLPGDTLWIHGGVYHGSFVSTLAGIAGLPVIVRNYQHDRASISVDSIAPALTIEGSNTWYWGLEITTTDTNTGIGGSGGINVLGDSNKLIQCIVHDMLGDGIEDQNCRDTEIDGCVVFFNGRKTDDANYAYGVYGQSAVGHKVYRDNFFIHNFGSYQIHIYTEQGAIDSFRIAHNVLANYANSATLLIGGGPHAARDCWIDTNYLFGTEMPSTGLAQVSYHEHADLQNPKIRGNYFMRGQLLLDTGTTGRELEGNINYGEDPFYTSGAPFITDGYPGNTWFTAPFGADPPRPLGVWTFIRPDFYTAGRANVIVYNWDGADSVEIDPSAVLKPGDGFAVLDAQNIFGPPVATGRYAGGAIRIPLAGLAFPDPVSYPAALGPPRHTSKTFGTFILEGSTASAPLDVGRGMNIAGRFRLDVNFPNPFNPSTIIGYVIPAGAGDPGVRVTLRVVDVLGRTVETLVDEVKGMGRYSVRWDAESRASGVYYCVMRAGTFTQARPMLLLR